MTVMRYDKLKCYKIRPRYVSGCGVYVEVNRSARDTFVLCYKMLAVCGYKADDLKIKVEE